LAELANNTSAQVRRDLMITGYTGTPRKGYDVKELINRINSILDDISEQKIALIGIGNLGRAILSYFSYQQPTLSIVAAFDSDESKTNRVIGGCRCYHIREFDEKIKELKITLGIITVPAQHAQDVADMMTQAGIKGILNFAPVPLRVPEEVFTDRIDITTALEKIAYFASSD
jgi:redox-sensing transcriptional repressor